MNVSMSTKVYSKGNAKPDKDQYMRQICTMDGGLNMSHITKKWYPENIIWLSGKLMHNIRA